MDEIELSVELRMVKANAEGLKWLVIGLTLALVRAEAIDLRKIAETLAVVNAFVLNTESEAATLPLQSTIGVLDAMMKNPEVDPLMTMVTSALLNAEAGKERREALQSWLSQGTAAEISEEIQQLFARLRAEPPPKTGETAE